MQRELILVKINTYLKYPEDFFDCDRKHLDIKFSTKYFSASEKYGWNYFEHDYVKSIVLINIRKKNNLLENTIWGIPYCFPMSFSQRHQEWFGFVVWVG